MIKAIKPITLRRAIAYLRMSTDEQTLSIPDQLAAIQRWCDENGYYLVRTYQDPGISGDQWGRPDFQRLQNDLRDKCDFDAVVVWNSSRFSRLQKAKAMLAYGTVFDAGVDFIQVQKNKITKADGDIAEHILLAVEQHTDHEPLVDGSAGVARHRVEMLSVGKWAAGRAPYGFRIDLSVRVNRKTKRAGTGKLIPIPETIKWVKVIFEKFLGGMSIGAIARWLNKQPHIPSPFEGHPWSWSGVRWVLSNPAYVGHSRYAINACGKYHAVIDGVIVPNKKTRGQKKRWSGVTPSITYDTHDAEIDRDIFQRAQDKLAGFRRNPRDGQRAYALGGLLTCAHCGGRMHGCVIRGEERYQCVSAINKRRGGRACKHEPSELCGYSLPAAQILDRIRHIILTRYLSDESLEIYRSQVEAYLGRRYGQAADAMASIAARLKECQKQATRYRKLLGATDDGDLIADYERSLKTAHETERDLLREQSMEQHLTGVGAAAVSADSAKIVAQLKRLRDVVQDNDPKLLRGALDQLIDRVEIKVDQHPTNPKARLLHDVEVFFRNSRVALVDSPANGTGIHDIVNGAEAPGSAGICCYNNNKPSAIMPASICWKKPGIGG